MKKLFTFLLICIGLTSCSDYGNDTDLKVVNLTIPQADWIESIDNNNLNRYYAATFNMPEITNEAYENGAVICYITFNQTQQPLPFVRHKEDNNARWTETVDFEYEPGKLHIYFTSSDFIQQQPVDMTFRVVILQPE